MKTQRRVLAILTLLAILAMSAAGWWFLFLGHTVSDACRLLGLARDHSTGQIRVSGNIETTEVQIAFKIPGRVEQRLFDEGELVKQGAKVAVLDTDDLRCNVALRSAEVQVARAALDELLAGSRKEEIASAEAAYRKASHTLLDLEAGSRPQEIAAAEAAVAAAAADMDRLEANFRRASALFQKQTISAEEFDQAKAARHVAVERHRQAVEQSNLLKAGFRQEQIEEARSALNRPRRNTIW